MIFFIFGDGDHPVAHEVIWRDYVRNRTHRSFPDRLVYLTRGSNL